MPTPTPSDQDTTTRDRPHTSFIQCRLPANLYEWMRLQGFLSRRSMNSIAVASIDDYRAEVETGRIAPERGAHGGGEMVKYNVQVKDDLHEWLRTTAFYARTSINALLIAALTRARAAQTDGTPRP